LFRNLGNVLLPEGDNDTLSGLFKEFLDSLLLFGLQTSSFIFLPKDFIDEESSSSLEADPLFDFNDSIFRPQAFGKLSSGFRSIEIRQSVATENFWSGAKKRR